MHSAAEGGVDKKDRRKKLSKSLLFIFIISVTPFPEVNTLVKHDYYFETSPTYRARIAGFDAALMHIAQ
jgi:hypothetical protein